MRTGYSALQIGLHWVMAVLIIAAFVSHEAMEEISRTGVVPEGPPAHTILGGLVFVLVLIRILVRLRVGAPEPDENLPAWNKIAAIWGHRLLYALMVVVPLGGAAVWYGGIEAFEDAHGALGTLLIVVALGHALVAIVHHVKDGETLSRMVRPSRDP